MALGLGAWARARWVKMDHKVRLVESGKSNIFASTCFWEFCWRVSNLSLKPMVTEAGSRIRLHS